MLNVPPILRRSRNVVVQIFIVVVLALFFYAVGKNYLDNIRSRNIGIGFGFLDDTAGFSISQTLIPYTESDTFGRTFFVGLLNTVLASAISILLATVLGFVLGLLRLSNNWLAARTSLGLVELTRNIPPLLHVLFWYQVAFLRILPPLEDAWRLPGAIFISRKGITFPEIHATRGVGYFWLSVVLCVCALIALSWYRRREIRNGRHRRVWPFQVGIIVVPIAIVALASPFSVVPPEMGRFRFTSGVTFLPELFSIVAAMSTYTASYIAEIVRNSIIGVPKGQIEAGSSLGFTRAQQLRLIIVPQALRTMVPPVTNQYLNIIKNTSLGVAIAYPDLTAVFAGTALNQSGRALEIMFMVMTTYLMVNLVTSFLMNVYNAKIIDKKGRSIDPRTVG